jgi:thiol-disulfide isomerase/thioredoxin
MQNFDSISDIDTLDNVIEQNLCILIDFWGTKCIRCVELESTIKKLSKIYNMVKFIKINANDIDTGDIIDRYEIKELPTFVLIKGKQVITIIRNQDCEELQRQLMIQSLSLNVTN